MGLTNQALAQLLQWWTPLTTLDLRGCRQLTRLPQDAVVTCPNLTSVLLDPERMVSPPPEVCATGADAIVRFLRAFAAGDNVTCNIVKLVTVGGPFEGKSSLVDLLKAGAAVLSTGPQAWRELAGRPVAARTRGLEVSRVVLPVAGEAGEPATSGSHEAGSAPRSDLREIRCTVYVCTVLALPAVLSHLLSSDTTLTLQTRHGGASGVLHGPDRLLHPPLSVPPHCRLDTMVRGDRIGSRRWGAAVHVP